MAENTILLTNDTVEFLGFDLLKEKITFCFYSGGITIVPEWETQKLRCHYESILDDTRRIHDSILVQILKDRGIDKKDNFVKIRNHYIEIDPHQTT